MAFNGYLTNQEIGDLAQAALNGGLLDAPRQVLLAGIPAAFAAAMTQTDNRLDQFTLDLMRVNAVERMAGGDVPVLTMLRNAASRLRLLDRQEAEVFERVLNRAESAAGGVPQLGEPTQLPELIANERMADADGTLDTGFLPSASGYAPEPRPAPDVAEGAPQAPPGKTTWRIGSWDVTIRAALIGGVFVIIAALIPFFLGAYSGTPQPGGSPSAGSSSLTSPNATPGSPSPVILKDPSSRGVSSVAFSYDHKYVATADANGNAYVWATPADTIANTLHAPTSKGVNTVAFSKTGKLATGNGNGRIYLWAGGHSYKHFTDPASKGVNAIAFSPNSQYLAAADANGHTYIWDMATGKIVANLPDPSSRGIRSVAFSYDHKYVATADANGNTYVWATPADTIANTLHAPTSKGVNTVAFSKTGKLATGNGNGRIYLWAGGHSYKHFTDPASKGVNAIAFSPNSQYLAAADANGHTYIWDMATGKIVTTLPDPSSQGARSAAFSAKGNLVAVGDGNGNTYVFNLSHHGG